MTKYELNLTNIDEASKTVTDFLSNEKVASKEVQRIRLSVEEILLKYLDSLNSGTSFEIVTAKRFRTMKIELVISSFIPFFVFGSIFNMIVGGNLLSVAKSYKLILVMLLGDLVLMAAYLLLVSVRKKVAPTVLLKKLMPTYIIGLTTASAVAAYQTNISTCEKKLGIDKKLIDIGIPLGQVIFMPGAIVLFVAAAFGMAETYGVAITPIWMLTVFIISVILAIAAPPVPGAALTCYTILFMQLGIPTEAIAVVIALNVILEFVATAVNLFCLQTELVELSGSLQTLKTDVLRNKSL